MGTPFTETKVTKPTLKITGEDNSVSDLITASTKALTDVGQTAEANKLISRTEEMNNFDEVLAVVKEYCNIEQ